MSQDANAIDLARALVADNLPQAASEVMEWRASGVLSNGVISKVGDMLRMQYPHDYMRQAESLVVKAALQFAAAFAT